jgi:Cu2+-containing amine oxidase
MILPQIKTSNERLTIFDSNMSGNYLELPLPINSNADGNFTYRAIQKNNSFDMKPIRELDPTGVNYAIQGTQ